MINVTVNESRLFLDKPTELFALRDQLKPGADIVIVNGVPVRKNQPVKDRDSIVFLKIGEKPDPREIEHLMMMRHGPGVYEKVKGAVVGIAGCGGLGSAVAISLARLGVARIVAADYDVVEPSNLNRQQYFIDQIGMPKVDALKANLKRTNPLVEIVAHNTTLTRRNIPSVFRECAVVAECFDNPSAKREMLVCVREKMPKKWLVTVSGIAGYGPGSAIRVKRIYERTFLVGDSRSESSRQLGLLAPRVMLAAGVQANLIMRILLGEIGEKNAD